MILFFRTPTNSVIATECNQELNAEDVKKLCWLYSDATVENEDNLKGWFIGPRREMITPWSTNAVEITQNMGLNGIRRIEEYFPVKDENADHDPMLQRMYHGLDQEIFTVDIKPQPIIYIEKAIIDSDLGIMPENNGEVIRIGIPPLTEERRKQLAKQCKGEGETAKVSVRNARRDGIDALKKAVKDGLAEDEQKNAEAKLQKIHDKYIKQIDDMLAEKDKEIMTV